MVFWVKSNVELRMSKETMLFATGNSVMISSVIK